MGFLQKNAFYRTVHFPAEKSRTMHFPAEECGFRGAHGRKPQEIVGGFQGLRIKNASQLAQEQRLFSPKDESEIAVPVLSSIQGRKRNPNLNFLVRISSGGVGVFQVQGWGQEVRYVLRNPLKPNFWADILGSLPGYFGNVRKV